MNLDVRRFLVPVVIFVVGMALFTLMALLGLPSASLPPLLKGSHLAGWSPISSSS